MELHSDYLTPSEKASTNTPRPLKEQFYKGQHVWVVLGNNKEDAVIHDIVHDSPDSLADDSDDDSSDYVSDDSTDDSPAIVTIRWKTRGTLEDFPIDSIRPMFDHNNGELESSSYSKRCRKKTDKYAPPSIFSANSSAQAKVTPTKKEKEEDTTKALTAMKRKGVGIDGSSEAGPKKPKGSFTAEVTLSDESQHSHDYVLSTVDTRDVCFNHLDSYQETISDTARDSYSRKRSTDALDDVGLGWKRISSKNSERTCWLSPGARIKFVDFEAALKYEELRKKYSFDDARAWNEHLSVSAGVEDSRYQFTMGNITKSNTTQSQNNPSPKPSTSLRSTEPSVITLNSSNGFNVGQLVYVIAGKARHEAQLLSIENCADSNGPRMATVNYKTWKLVEKVEVNQLRHIHDGSKRVRKPTNRFAPPSPPSEDPESRSSQANEMEGLSSSDALSKKARTHDVGHEKSERRRTSCRECEGCQTKKSCTSKSKFGGPVKKKSACLKEKVRVGKPKKIRSKIEKEETSNSQIEKNDDENEYNILWDYYMEPRVRKNEELFGSGMVLREKVVKCDLLRSKNDTFRPKVHKKIMRLHKDGNKSDIVRILRLMREYDSGKLSDDELQQLKKEILGPTTDHGDIEVFDSLAACVGNASIDLIELDDEGINRELSYAGALARQHHPDTSISNGFDETSRLSNYLSEVAARDADRSSFSSFDDEPATNNELAADSRKISIDSAHSPQAPNEFIDLCWHHDPEPSLRELKLPTGEKRPTSAASIDTKRTADMIDLSRDDDIDNNDSQQAQGQQKDAGENTTDITNESFNEGLVDLSQESDEEDLPSDWV